MSYGLGYGYMTHLTFANNISTQAQGGAFYGGGNLEIYNSIFWGNTSPGIINAGLYYSIVQGGYSNGYNIIDEDPRLDAPIAYDQFTHAFPLLSGSPAIDAANDSHCPATDQRGMARPQGDHCDIGAYEFDAQNYTLTVARYGSGSGTVSSSPDGVSCGSDCSGTYLEGTQVTLTATPSTGSTFAGWSGACSGTGTCVVTMTAPRSVYATFSLSQYSLSVSKSGTGSGTISSNPTGISCGSNCIENYDYNTVVTLSATPSNGSTFAGWSGACSGMGTCQVTMSQARSVTASFSLNQYTLTVSKSGTGSGNISSSPTGISCGNNCTQNYGHNSQVTLTASAETGSVFAGWSGACSGTGTCQVAMTQARSVTATFDPVPIGQYALTVSLAGTGSGTVTGTGINCFAGAGADCTETYTEGTQVTLTAAPSTNSAFSGWSGACGGTGTCQVTMNAAKSVSATFDSAADTQIIFLPMVIK